MIFKNWFAPKWQHKNPDVRLQALANLTKEQHATALNQLILDQDDRVRKQALLKLNDLALWYQALKQDQAASIKNHAKAVLANALSTDYPSVASQPFKQAVLEDLAQGDVLYNALQHETDPALQQRLIEKQDQSFLLKVLADAHFSATLKRNLLEQASEELLNKAVKLVQGDLHSEVHAKLAQLQLAKTEPERVRKQLRLVLAKLNALIDKNDFDEFHAPLAGLLTQWQQLREELHWLPAPEQEQFSSKFGKIQTLLESRQAKLIEAHEQQLAVQAAVAQRQAQQQQVSDTVSQFQQAVVQAEQGQAEFDFATWQTRLEPSQWQAVPAALTAPLNPLRKQLAQLQQQLQFAEQQRQEWHHQFFKFLSCINDEQQRDGEQVWQLGQQLNRLQQYANDEQRADFAKHWQQLREQRKAAQHAFKEAKEQASKAIADIERLLRQGRLNIAIRVHQKLSELLPTLAEEVQQALAARVTAVNSELEKLLSWQRDLTLPKRQQLIADIQLLADTPLSPDVQATHVKQLREQWQQLGPISAQDQALFTQFDALCEQAFAPCRSYFAEQQALREQNRLAKQALLDSLEALTQAWQAQQVTVTELESQWLNLQKAWRDVGELERQHHVAMTKQYRSAESLIRKAINQWQQDNASAKSALIDQAQQWANNDDYAAACNALKILQQQWKTIGYAGNKQDKALWQAFRAINDTVFAQRQQQLTEQKQQQAQAKAEHEQQWQSLLALPVEQQLMAINQWLADNSLHPALYKTAQQHLAYLADQQQQAKRAAAASKRAAQFATLAANEPDDSINKRFGQSTESRRELTIMLELLHSQHSADDEAVVAQVKLAMLSDKLNGGQILTVEALIERWFAAGEWDASQAPLAQRLANLFAS